MPRQGVQVVKIDALIVAEEGIGGKPRHCGVSYANSSRNRAPPGEDNSISCIYCQGSSEPLRAGVLQVQMQEALLYVGPWQPQLRPRLPRR